MMRCANFGENICKMSMISLIQIAFIAAGQGSIHSVSIPMVGYRSALYSEILALTSFKALSRRDSIDFKQKSARPNTRQTQNARSAKSNICACSALPGLN